MFVDTEPASFSPHMPHFVPELTGLFIFVFLSALMRNKKPTAIALRVSHQVLKTAGANGNVKQLIEAIDMELDPVIHALDHVARCAASKHNRYVAQAALLAIRGQKPA